MESYGIASIFKPSSMDLIGAGLQETSTKTRALFDQLKGGRHSR